MKNFVLAVSIICGLTAAAGPSTVAQVPDSDFSSKWWFGRFDEKRDQACATNYPVIFLGDSITKGWETVGRNVWAENFASGRYMALNCGFSGDRTEHVLWRLDHGQFGTSQPRAVVVMIGTNNTGHHERNEETPIDTIAGVRAIVWRIRDRYPAAKVILHPILPRGRNIHDINRFRNDIVNEKIACLADGENVVWCDFNARLVAADGTLSREMAPDLLHPGETGYRIWADAVKPYLDWALGFSHTLPAPAAPMVTAIEPKTNAAPVNISAGYGWFDDGRLQRKRAEVMANPSHWYDLVMLGDSITHGWESVGLEVWQRRFLGYKVLDLGFGGDRVQGQLWNAAYGGLLDGYRAGVITILIGCNNSNYDSAEDIAAGIRKLVGIVREKQPYAKIVLMGILPVGREPGTPRRLKHEKTNAIIRSFADGKTVCWLDLSPRFLDANGRIPKRLLHDFCHPTAKGYEIWAEAILPYLKQVRERR